jgi:hypothetical protein
MRGNILEQSMQPTVYIETSIVGYLTSRRSVSLVTAGNQELTHEWWAGHRERFQVYVSAYVVAECASGDEHAANDRLSAIADIPQLAVSDAVSELAIKLMNGVPLPEKAEVDALHISIAAVHGIEYLLTWNCKHIANASLRPRIETVCRIAGYEPPTICTPQELMEIWP